MKIAFLNRSILLIASVLCIKIAQAQTGGRVRHSTSTQSRDNTYLNVNEDTSANQAQTRITYRTGEKQYDIKMVMDKVTEIYINHRKIPADSIYVYNGIINKIKKQVKEDKIQAEEDRKQAVKDQEEAKKDMLQAEEDREQVEKDRKQSAIDMEQAKANMLEAEENRKQAKEDMEQAEEDRKQAAKDHEQAKIDEKHAEEDRALVKALIDELVKEHIIPDEKSLSQLVLTEDEFIINGKKQSAELHNKFKAKFIKKPGYSISYGGYTSGYGVYINNEVKGKK